VDGGGAALKKQRNKETKKIKQIKKNKHFFFVGLRRFTSLPVALWQCAHAS
jgi:hypothetical protein